MDDSNILIFLVDDDALYLKSLEIDFLKYPNISVIKFLSGESCIEALPTTPDIIILDYHLDGFNPNAMNGIETLDKIKAFNADIPVIMLSSQDKIEVAIKCMHHLAIDYIVKSETAFVHLQKTITNTLRYKKIEKILNWYMEKS